uniref:CSON015508 protein n=1 Tax=Culicoides sonorensis TaxID=179676 RepID=A0A336LSZ3_CULSO
MHELKLHNGKYLVLPSGELHIKEVGPEDGYKSYQCRTKHRLTGETRLSATKGRLVITERAVQISMFQANSFMILSRRMNVIHKKFITFYIKISKKYNSKNSLQQFK